MKGKVLEDINDHATSEYVRLFRECVEDSRVSLLGKAASIVQDAATKVFYFGRFSLATFFLLLYACYRHL